MVSRKVYQGSTAIVYHLEYGSVQYNVTMSWLSVRHGYQIEVVSVCEGNCSNPDFPYRVSQKDLQKIEELLEEK